MKYGCCLIRMSRELLRYEGGAQSPVRLSKLRIMNKVRVAGFSISVDGGVSVIRQFLAGGQIDEMHLAMGSVFLGEGEHLFAGMDLHKLGFTIRETMAGEHAMHILITRK